MSTAAATQGVNAATKLAGPMELTVYAHSTLLYWWPVWVTGFLMAFLTYLEGKPFAFEDATVIIHPSKNLGVIYTMVFLLVVIMTNATMRGLASALVITVMLALTFLFAYLDWWEDILRTMSYLAIFMNLGFYVFFSTAILIVWLLGVFVFDRLEYWTFRPGQVVHNRVIGGGARSYDTTHMSVYKLRNDLFRHWILGLGSGDLHIATAGAASTEMVLPNVLFAGSKVQTIEQLVAMKPDERAATVPMTVGEPS